MSGCHLDIEKKNLSVCELLDLFNSTVKTSVLLKIQNLFHFVQVKHNIDGCI